MNVMVKLDEVQADILRGKESHSKIHVNMENVLIFQITRSEVYLIAMPLS